MSEPKVTECWADLDSYGCPESLDVLEKEAIGYRPAILLWREDYDAMRKELEELRKNYNELIGRLRAQA